MINVQLWIKYFSHMQSIRGSAPRAIGMGVCIRMTVWFFLSLLMSSFGLHALYNKVMYIFMYGSELQVHRAIFGIIISFVAIYIMHVIVKVYVLFIMFIFYVYYKSLLQKDSQASSGCYRHHPYIGFEVFIWIYRFMS